MTRPLPPLVRRLVLGGALAAATLLCVLPGPTAVLAQPVAPAPLAQPDAKQSAKDAAREAGQAAKEAAREAADLARDATREARRKGIKIDIDDSDREYDSFDEFLDRDPALASMVLGIVFIVFLTPILIIALVIWYKMRKNRMQNETMLKLAEKGIVPPGAAMQAIGTGRAEPVLDAAAARLPLTEQARLLRKEAAWSDLRKGVLLGAVGLAITFWSMINHGEANWFGLVLLFVGIGYCILWYFEDRQAAAAAAGPMPAPGPGDVRN
ncbi:MAG: DUF6249 domain-containing protein [Burkholderiales bacterium]